MSFYTSFPEYVSVAEKKRKAEKAREKLKKQNPNLSPVIINGTSIAKSWWSKAWNTNLERYSDYSNRIGRGRSYVRNGAVLDLQITTGKIHALVQGSTSRPYEITVSIHPLSDSVWRLITKSCEGKIDSMQTLLEGKFPKDLMELFTVQGSGLFPSPKEIKFSCNCPDWASMCKHIAAVLYGIGARLDENPELFFVLRNVKLEDLVFATVGQQTKTLLEKSKKESSRIIENTDVSALFGIDMDESILSEVKKPVGKIAGEKGIANKKAVEKKPVVMNKPTAVKKPAASKKAKVD